MLSWQVGAVKVTRVVEMELPVKAGADFFMPQATPQELRKSPWLYPDFVSEDEIMQMSIHALLVEAPGLRLVVDTCIGNDKPRSLLRGGALSTNFLEDLEAVGWTRESVDAVVCTHLHVDHVGWNTMLVDGKWVPTFPNARYLIGRVEYEHWIADGAGEQQAILDDSRQADLRRGPRRTGRAGPSHLARDPPDPHHRPHARPRQRDDRVRGREGGDHRRHEPPPLPAGPSRLVADIRRRSQGRSGDPRAAVRRMGRRRRSW